MVGNQKYNQKNSPEVSGKHFNILKWYLYVLFFLGSINLALIIASDYNPDGPLAQFKSYIFSITIPVIITFMVLIIRKMIDLQKRTKMLVEYVDQIVNNENKFRSLFENSFTGHVLLHPEKGIVDFNEAFCRLIQTNGNELKEFSSYVGGRYHTDQSGGHSFEDFITECLYTGNVIGFWKLKSSFGEEVPTKISATKILLDDEDYIMLSIHDETMNELRQNQLRKITARAVEATKAKSEFLANITHELRTPLNGIIGLSEDLVHSSVNEQVLNDAKIINESGKNLLGLINNVLDYSKLDANKITLESIPIHVEDFVRQIDNTLSSLAEKKSIDFRIVLDENLPKAFIGDKVRLSQVLINLVGNAIKFTEQGEVIFTLSVLEETNDSQIKLNFQISDTGIGISKENINKLFTSFEQADSTISRKFGGTGLGLSISKQLVELMGSSIDVQSEMGKGSVFSFEFITKIARTIEKTNEKTNLESVDEIQLDEEILKKKILIAEDNKVNQIVAKKHFSRLGFQQIDFAENGKIALEMIHENGYDYVFMDMQMPVMDGIQATEKIFEQLHFLDAPIVIAMTANNSDEDKKKCIASGMTGFLTKPLSLNELKQVFIDLEGQNLNVA